MNTNSERKQIIRSGLWGTLAGFALSLTSAFLLVSLFTIFFVVIGEYELSFGILFLAFNTLLFGLGIAGIPSGVVGLVTGSIIGVIMSRQKTELSRLSAGFIGLSVSIVVTILGVLIMVITNSTSAVTFLFPLAIIYWIGSYFIGPFVYRRVFVPSQRNKP